VTAPAPHAERPPDLTGRTVALLDITKNRSAEFLDRIDRLLQERGASTFRIAKAAFSRPAAPEVIEEIAIRGDLVVEGLAD
jgi:alpha-galactosidase/6-phospho-beta-glucosidase family protein